MKKNIFLFMVAAAIIVLGPSYGMAWSLDLANSASDPFTLNIQFIVDEDETFELGVYQLNVIPDNGYVSATHSTPSGMFSFENPETQGDAATDDKIGDWAAGLFPYTSTGDDIFIGSVTFDYEVIAGADVFWGYEHIDFGGLFNGLTMSGLDLYNTAHLSYNGVTSAVPVPAAVWLLGSGLLGLVGVRRYKK